MNTPRFRVLAGVLAVLAVVAVIVFVVRSNTPKSAQDRLQERMAVTGAINKSITRIQNTQKRWPKGLDELRTEPELASLPPEALEGVTCELVRVEEKRAVYRTKIGGKVREIGFPKWMPSMGSPTLAHSSSVGG